MVKIRGVALALTLGGLGLLWGCDQGSAPARDHSGSAGAPRSSDRVAGDRSGGDRSAPVRPRTPTPMVDGKPVWADNNKHSAQENLEYQFSNWGSTIEAKDAPDYGKKARAFVASPPAGAEKITRRNGDVLIFDHKTGTFAIARRDGAPRLFRRPPDADAVWAKAKSEADAPSSGASRRRYRAPDPGDYNRGASE